MKAMGTLSLTLPTDIEYLSHRGYADVRTRHGEERLRGGKDGGFDFIDFIEGQFGAILYSMVLFLLFFMVIFSTVMRLMLVSVTPLPPASNRPKETSSPCLFTPVQR